jgi:hypothetical protein
MVGRLFAPSDRYPRELSAELVHECRHTTTPSGPVVPSGPAARILRSLACNGGRCPRSKRVPGPRRNDCQARVCATTARDRATSIGKSEWRLECNFEFLVDGLAKACLKSATYQAGLPIHGGQAVTDLARRK